MKKNWRNSFYLYVIMLLLFSACNSKHAEHVDEQYTCAMHPQIIQDTPGTCPICGMDLVRKNQKGEEVKITTELGYLLKPSNALVISSIKTIVPVQKSMTVKVEAKGMIAHDTRKIATISARVGGRIEKLFIKYNLHPVQKGQKIMELYSPELIAAQRELLYVLESDAMNINLIESSKQKLKLLGLSETQINKLITSKQESYSFTIFSPVDGYVTEHTMLNGNVQSMEESSESANAEFRLREGMYVTAGQSVFTVVSHADLWAEFDLLQRDVPFIKLKDPAIITLDNTYGNIKAQIDFLQPFIKNGESLTKIRMYLPNTHFYFHAGQLVTATFTSTTDNVTWIPTNAKINLGTQNVVFVKRSGVFKPTTISIGRETEGWVEVRSGIELTDTVANNAQFMIDSEAFIKVNENN